MSDRPDSPDSPETSQNEQPEPAPAEGEAAPAAAVPRRRLSRRARVAIIAGAAVVAVVAAGVAVAVPRLEASDTRANAPTHTPSHTPTTSQPVQTQPPKPIVDTTVYAPGTFSGWTAQGLVPGYSFGVTTAGVHSGATALRIDASGAPSSATRAALIQTVTTAPNTEYTLSAWVTQPLVPQGEPAGQPSGATISIDGIPQAGIRIAKHAGAAQQVSATFRTGAQGASTVRITTDAATAGVIVDDIALAPAAGAPAAIANASFEQYSTPAPHFADSSMIISEKDPTLDVAWFTRSVHYTITDVSGTQVADGDQPTRAGVAGIPLTPVGQGWFSVKVSADGTSLASNMVVVDPASNGATSDPRLGVFAHTYPEYAGSEPLASALGLSSVRMDSGWAKSEARPGVYAFSPLLGQMGAQFEKDGLTLLPIIGAQNRNYDHNKAPSSAAAIAAYANFAAWVVRTWNPPSVEVFNEFNNKPLNNSLCGTSADCYLPLLQAVYTKVKAINPNIKVVGGATAHADNAWIARLLQLGGGKYLDAISIHPYNNEGTPEILAQWLPQTEQTIRNNNGGTAIPLWITELGWPSNVVGDENQAQYLIQAETIALGNGVQEFYWYDLIDDSSRSGKGWEGDAHFGLFTSASSGAAKPAAFAQALMVRQLAGRPAAGRDDLGAAVYSYRFGSGADGVRVAWATSGATVTLHTTSPVTMTSATGASSRLTPQDGTIRLPLTATPVFLSGDVQSVTAG